MTVVLRVERDGSPTRDLPLVGHWERTVDGPLRLVVDGEVFEGEVRFPTTGSVLVWPRRAFGGVVGMHRITLDVSIGPTRLLLDGEVGPPPYWRGVALPGRVEQGRRRYEVRVSIDPLRLLEVWLDLAAAPTVDG